MKPHVIHSLSSEIAFGLHELLRTNAANIHKSDDWFTLFSLLEVVGAAAHPPPVLQPTAQSPSTDKTCSYPSRPTNKCLIPMVNVQIVQQLVQQIKVIPVIRR